MFISSSSLALWLIERYKSARFPDNRPPRYEIGSEEHEFNYVRQTISNESKKGIGVTVYEKDVLEIGCGRGGISICIAMNAANSVTGIDISDDALRTAEKVKGIYEYRKLIRKDVVSFKKENVEQLSFPDESFDVVIADNVFEHVANLSHTIKECKRVLKKGGILYVPNFPPIYSRFGPHLKYGSKIPWLHVFFTEKAICRAVYKRALKHPELKLFEYYPGLKDQPLTFRDVRKHKDLNYITNQKFIRAVRKNGMHLNRITFKRSVYQKILVALLPFLRKTRLGDILSFGTAAIIKK